MQIEKFTYQMQQALSHAQSMAAAAKNTQIEIDHLFYCLLQVAESNIAHLLQIAGVDIASLEEVLKKRVGNLAVITSDARTGGAIFSHTIIALLEEMEYLAQQSGDQFISTDTFLTALLNTQKRMA